MHIGYALQNSLMPFSFTDLTSGFCMNIFVRLSLRSLLDLFTSIFYREENTECVWLSFLLYLYLVNCGRFWTGRFFISLASPDDFAILSSPSVILACKGLAIIAGSAHLRVNALKIIGRNARLLRSNPEYIYLIYRSYIFYYLPSNGSPLIRTF